MLGRVNRRAMAYITCGFLVVALAGIGLAAAGALSPDSRPPSAPPVGSSVARLSSAARESFSVFAQPEGTSEDVSRVNEVVQGLNVNIDPASVRLAQTSSDMEVLVGGDSESLCLTLRLPGKAMGGGCSTEVSAASPGTPMVSATVDPTGGTSSGRLSIAALFPDGTANVTLTGKDGSVTSVRIVNNTIAAVATATDILGWMGPEGRSYSSPLPG